MTSGSMYCLLPLLDGKLQYQGQVYCRYTTACLQGDLNADYSLIFGASCLLGALLGVVVINSVVRRR